MNEQLQTLVSQAGSALRSGAVEQAESLSRQALQTHPEDPAANLILGSVLNRLGRLAEAIPHFRVVASADASRFSAQFALGHLLLKTGQMPEAREVLARAVALNPEHGQAQHSLAVCLHQAGDFDAALPHYQKAVLLDPDASEYHNDLGVLQTNLGMGEAAASSYREAVRLNPGRGKLIYNMSSVHGFKPDDPEFELMLEQFEAADDNVAKRVYLAFSLGKAYADIGDAEQSFHYYQIGNRSYRETYEFAVATEVDRLRRIKEHFNAPDFLQGAKADTNGIIPLFIMGMPRSGTTLTEQILASHSRTEAVGETDFFGGFVRARAEQTGLSFPELLKSCSAQELSQLGQDYLDRYGRGLEAGDVLVEKTTMNFYYLGFLKRVFPEARFVYCVRDAIDTCWSIYTRYFVQGGHHYGYDLFELGQYYQVQQAMVAYWQTSQANDIFTVEYEALVSEPESVIKSLLDACGLAFEAACLKPHETTRGVRTASAAQVRKPIYQSGQKSWSPFKGKLQDLRRGLDTPVAGLAQAGRGVGSR